jgi:predicted transcriptional regulator
MRDRPIRMFDERDEELVELLTKTGLNRNLAKVIVYLSSVDEAVSREIEMAANLRQPEVSLAMNELRQKNWIEEKEIKKKGKGRPLKSYRLLVDLRDIVEDLIKKKREELEQMKKDLDRLEELTS